MFFLSCPQRSQTNKSNKNKANLRTNSLKTDTLRRSSRQLFSLLMQSNAGRKKMLSFCKVGFFGRGLCWSCCICSETELRGLWWHVSIKVECCTSVFYQLVYKVHIKKLFLRAFSPEILYDHFLHLIYPKCFF